MRSQELTGRVIAAAIEVHRNLGPGLLESTYTHCLGHELALRGLRYWPQVPLPVVYKGNKLDCGYRMDFVVSNEVVIEVKSVEAIHPLHIAQLLTYLKLSGHKVGLLVNFNVPVLRDGIRRLVNDFDDNAIEDQ